MEMKNMMMTATRMAFVNPAIKRHPNDEETEVEEQGRVDLSSRCPLTIDHGSVKPVQSTFEIVITIDLNNDDHNPHNPDAYLLFSPLALFFIIIGRRH